MSYLMVAATITEADLEAVEYHGSVVVMQGTAQDDDVSIRFAVDPREAVGIMAIVESAGELVVGLESWAIVGVVG